METEGGNNSLRVVVQEKQFSGGNLEAGLAFMAGFAYMVFSCIMRRQFYFGRRDLLVFDLASNSFIILLV